VVNAVAIRTRGGRSAARPNQTRRGTRWRTVAFRRFVVFALLLFRHSVVFAIFLPFSWSIFGDLPFSYSTFKVDVE
jgi:cell division septal protein FtsQ